MLTVQSAFFKAYGSTGWEAADWLLRCDDGGYLFGGWTESYGAGLDDILLCRISDMGEVVWAKTYGGPDYDWAQEAISVKDGSFILVGGASGYGSGWSDMLAMRVDSLGNILWARIFSGPYPERLIAIDETPDSCYIMAGSSYDTAIGRYDPVLLKIDRDGNLLWSRMYWLSNDDDYPRDIISTPDGGCVVAGYSTDQAHNSDPFIVRFDSSGVPLWARMFYYQEENFWEVGLSVCQTSPNTYTMVGAEDGFNYGDNADIFIVNVSTDGSLLSARAVGGNRDDGAYRIIRTSDSGAVIVGVTDSYGPLHYYNNVFLMKLDTAGGIQWALAYGDDHEEIGKDVVENLDGVYAISGYTDSFGSGDYEALVLALEYPGGTYPCIEAFTPEEQSVNPVIFSPVFNLLSMAFDTSTPPLTVTQISPLVTDACPAAVGEEMAEAGGPFCAPLAGGVLFVSSEPLPLVMYSVDGRLILSREIDAGKTQIPLQTGIYFWKAGEYRGKALVR